MDANAIETLFDYHYKMFDGVWECIREISDAQFVANCRYSLGSVRNHLVHSMNVDDRWLARLNREAPPQRLAPSDYPDRKVARLKWDEIRCRVLDSVEGSTKPWLNESIPIQLPERFPRAKRLKRWEILLHMVNHGTDHRAQILARLFELGAKTTEQDLILHLWTDERR